jgi:hypothetical protein
LEIACGKFEKRNSKYKKEIQNKSNLPCVPGNCSRKLQNPKTE